MDFPGLTCESHLRGSSLADQFRECSALLCASSRAFGASVPRRCDPTHLRLLIRDSRNSQRGCEIAQRHQHVRMHATTLDGLKPLRREPAPVLQPVFILAPSHSLSLSSSPAFIFPSLLFFLPYFLYLGFCSRATFFSHWGFHNLCDFFRTTFTSRFACDSVSRLIMSAFICFRRRVADCIVLFI